MYAKANPAAKPTPVKPQFVKCNICLAEIPESVAMSSEADEYTQYFCGIECYNRWHIKNEKAKKEG